MRDNARRVLAAGASTATVLLTAGAFWLSYDHLHQVAEANGMTGLRAWVWPATIDLFIVIGELLLLRSLLAGRGADRWAVGLTVVGSGGSIALNVGGVGSGAAVMTYVVAAVPPVAALLAFGALMRQVHERLAVPTPVPTPTPTLPGGQGHGAGQGGVSSDSDRSESESDFLDDIQEVPAEPAPEPAEPEALVPEPASGTRGVRTGHVRSVREWLAAEPNITGTEIGRRLGKSDSYGRKVKRAATAVP